MKPHLVAEHHHLKKMFLNSGVTPEELLKRGIIQEVDDLQKVSHQKVGATLIDVTREAMSDDDLMAFLRNKNINMTPDEYRQGAEKYFNQMPKDSMQRFQVKKLASAVAKKIAEEK